MQTCPKCGEWVPNTVTECTACGESFAGVPRTDDPRLKQVRTGITLVFFGLVVVLLAAIGGLILFWALQDPRVFLPTLITAIVAAIIGLAGKLLCLSVPPSVGASAIIYTSAGIEVATVILQAARFFVALPPSLAPIAVMAGIVAYVLFVVFLKRLADYIGRPDLAKLAEHVLSTGAFGIVLFFGGYFVGALLDVGRTLGGLMILFGAIVLLVAFVRYARVLHGLKAAI
jgi:hypothetical protein